jgi:hypothetical protein
VAGWINLKVMLVYSPDSFLLRPGAVLMSMGILLTLALSCGPVVLFGVGLNLHWMLFGVTCATLGFSCIQIGILARIMHGLRLGVETTVRRFLTYDRGMTIAATFVGIGLLLVGTLVWHYIAEDFKLAQISYTSILGLLLIILGFQTFGFTLLLEMSQRLGQRNDHE